MDILGIIDEKIREVRNSLSYYNKAYRECDASSFYKQSYKRNKDMLEGQLKSYRDFW